MTDQIYDPDGSLCLQRAKRMAAAEAVERAAADLAEKLPRGEALRHYCNRPEVMRLRSALKAQTEGQG